MKVFISWSGVRSQQVAELLDGWLRCVIQACDPWLSSDGIDRGALWFSEIASRLSDTSVGIICLTEENKSKPWILFEAGAISKGLTSNRVCTLLIDLKPSDVGNPLAQFNHTEPNQPGLLNLVMTINASLGEKALKTSVLESVFKTYWPDFKKRFDAILANTPAAVEPKPRDSGEVMAEVLEAVRSMEKRMSRLEDKSNDALGRIWTALSDNSMFSVDHQHPGVLGGAFKTGKGATKLHGFDEPHNFLRWTGDSGESNSD